MSGPEFDPHAAPGREPSDPCRLPDELTSPTAKLVYLAVSSSPGRTVEELSRDLGIPTLSLYPVTDTVVRAGWIGRTPDGRLEVVSREG